MSALAIDRITVRFGTTAVLEDVSLDVADHSVVGLLGPSGSGKSTLLRVVAGLLPPDGGRVLLDGRDVTSVPTHRRGIGLVFQDEQLFPHRDVADNIGFGLRMHRWPRHETRDRVEEMLELVDLAGFGPRTVTSLSGGEAKRVALARSLAPRPDVLLLDEPLTGLDRELHDALAVELRWVLRATATTAILVTHDPDEAGSIADRTVEIADLTAARHGGER